MRSQAREAAQCVLAEVRAQKEVKTAELTARIQCEMRNELMKSTMELKRDGIQRKDEGQKEKENVKKVSCQLISVSW